MQWIAQNAEAATLPIAGVSASGNDGNIPQNAIDGNAATRWSCDMSAAPCWIQTDIGFATWIDRVNIAWYQGDTRTNTFAVAVSTDGTNFATVFSGLSSGTTTAEESYSFAPTSGRYVRITVSDNSINNWASITEIRVEGTHPPPTELSIAAVNASGHDGNVPQNVLDDNLATRWSCDMSAAPCWIQADLGASISVDGVNLAWYQGTTRTNTFSISVSTDGTSFTPVFSGNSSGTTDAMERYAFASASARYVRITVTDNSIHNGWASVSEMQVTGAALPVTLSIASTSASGSDANVHQNAVDGNLGTRWSCDMSLAPCWIQADLGASHLVEEARIAWYQGNTRINTFSIALSTNGTNFTTVWSGQSSGTTANHETYSFTPAMARYVRVTVTANTYNTWASISELELRGHSFGGGGGGSDAGQLDVFGLTKINGTLAGGPVWNSQHWANGNPRTLTTYNTYDPDDPTQVSQKRGDASVVSIDGQGVMSFLAPSGASQPRLYLNRPSTHFFNNVEITIYFQRVGSDGAAWGGLTVGARSGPEGHGSNVCDAHTYYSRYMYSGRRDFTKELKHPNHAASTYAYMWPNNAPMPANQWIGMKFMVYNVNNNTAIKVEQWLDTTGGVNGGNWQKLREIVDAENWSPVPDSSGCTGYETNYVPITGGGTIILRNTDAAQSRYKWFSVREIAPPQS